ncbi:MAG: DUF3365 domain-containing protein [Myxococcales bacterium]|nr:DUF3365 domain-containing protein [Myxococcales bacterium]
MTSVLTRSVSRACFALVLLGSALGCKKTPTPPAAPNTGQPPSPKGVPLASAPEALQGAVKLADAAFAALKATLGARLKVAITAGGPVSAIAVCQEEAASLARTIEKESHVSVGRTSQRLRNPSNSPPWWAEQTVLSATPSDGLVFDLGASVGVLRPIRLEAVCTTCHGKELDPALAAELARRYPADQATGFAEGDLRGYFWADVPKT